jgi:hypothetical protein
MTVKNLPAMRLLSLFFLLLFFSACRRSNPIDPAKIGHVHRVVILGNSIVFSGPNRELGWEYSWGMAASGKDKDFVHLLIKDIHSRDTAVDIVYRNISGFERGYRHYQLGQLDSLRGADLYILKLAENVPDTATGFIPSYDSLLNHLNTRGGIKVIMDGFWKNPVNEKLDDYAGSHRLPFIRISDLSGDKSMEARGLFKNYGVSVHPSDKGMQAIEKRIWDYVQVYFLKRSN